MYCCNILQMQVIHQGPQPDIHINLNILVLTDLMD